MLNSVDLSTYLMGLGLYLLKIKSSIQAMRKHILDHSGVGLEGRVVRGRGVGLFWPATVKKISVLEKL